MTGQSRELKGGEDLSMKQVRLKPAYWGILLTVVVALLVLSPLGLLTYQSLLSAPFFAPIKQISLDAYRYVLTDPAFYKALFNSFIIALGMVVIAVPAGTALAFLVNKTDLPFRKAFELLLLTPTFVSPIILGIGFTIVFGPVGLVSNVFKDVFGGVPWNIYTLPSIAVIAGLLHVPYVYLYVSSTIRNLDASLEEAARVSGAGIWTVALSVTVPLVRPAVVYSAMLMLLLGFEIFGLPLVLGDSKGIDVITTYLYRLTGVTGVPAYGPMAVVAVMLIILALIIVGIQRKVLGETGNKYTSVGAKGYRSARFKLGSAKWWIVLVTALYLLVTVILPVFGVVLRSVVTSWGAGVNLLDVLTLKNYSAVFTLPDLSRGVINTFLVAIIGGFVAVGVYLTIASGILRSTPALRRTLDYLAGLPRSVPGLIMGLAFLWLFLFFKPVGFLRTTLVSLIIAYTIVWMPYGVRLLTATLMQISKDLEEAARMVGASPLKAFQKVTLPLLQGGLLSAWLLLFMQFVREYSTGVYLLTPGTEVLGSLIVSLWATGAVDSIAALSTIQIVIISIVYLIANKLGVKAGE